MIPAAMLLNILMTQYNENSSIPFDDYPFPVLFEAWEVGKENIKSVKKKHKNLLIRVLKETEAFLGIDQTVITCVDDGVNFMEDLI